MKRRPPAKKDTPETTTAPDPYARPDDWLEHPVYDRMVADFTAKLIPPPFALPRMDDGTPWDPRAELGKDAAATATANDHCGFEYSAGDTVVVCALPKGHPPLEPIGMPKHVGRST